MCRGHIGGALCVPLPLFCPSEAQGKLRLGRTHGAHLSAEGELPEGQERLAWATPPIKELAIRPGGRQTIPLISTKTT
jgi:hypothetical protein